MGNPQKISKILHMFAGNDDDDSDGQNVRTASCVHHGPYPSRRVSLGSRAEWTGCPTCCDDYGRQLVRDQMAARQRAQRESMMSSAAIPRRFLTRTLQNFVTHTAAQEHVLAVARKYVLEFLDPELRGRSLIFCGGVGTGKTHLAVGIARELMAMNLTVTFNTAMDAIRTVRETYRKESPVTEREVIRRFAQPDLVILDEIGTQFGTDAEKVTLFDLLNARYNAEKSTILISNLKIQEVEQYIGERMFDRLRENGGQALVFAWESYRNSSGRQGIRAPVNAHGVPDVH
ncbi:ATP-binding protein [Acidithiobacillus sp. CV18-2]|nr:ATP-binding protein [Acidithiobacillus sp. CV18-3]MBU2757504.1 ATP-binding protein [Acidithiobacillus sp. BN09-2]MBU2777214.1 ATP-binding protein [Acidithiobacillus sp. CV18-2]MBU2799937.1 ATP-binding protein [Acidithiobacillus sp. VAN18-4]